MNITFQNLCSPTWFVNHQLGKEIFPLNLSKEAYMFNIEVLLRNIRPLTTLKSLVVTSFIISLHRTKHLLAM